MLDQKTTRTSTLDRLCEVIERPLVSWLETLDEESLEMIALSFGLLRDRVLLSVMVATIVAGVAVGHGAPWIIYAVAFIEAQSCMLGDMARRLVSQMRLADERV